MSGTTSALGSARPGLVSTASRPPKGGKQAPCEGPGNPPPPPRKGGEGKPCGRLRINWREKREGGRWGLGGPGVEVGAGHRAEGLCRGQWGWEGCPSAGTAPEPGGLAVLQQVQGRSCPTPPAPRLLLPHSPTAFTFPTYSGSVPVYSSTTKNWFQTQPRFTRPPASSPPPPEASGPGPPGSTCIARTARRPPAHSSGSSSSSSWGPQEQRPGATPITAEPRQLAEKAWASREGPLLGVRRPREAAPASWGQLR